MSFPEDEQFPGSASVPHFDQNQDSEAEPTHAPEPRLLTRPDRAIAEKPARPRRSNASEAPAVSSRTPRQRMERPATQVRIPTASGRRSPTAKQPRSRRRRLGLWTIAGLAAAALLLLVCAAAMLYFRHVTQAALPQLDGTVQVPGLHSAVTVARDAQGVPTITAGSLDDLLFAQGYVTASDRLWQMDGLRRHSAGELAEVLGSSMVEHDRRQRYLQLRATAERALTQLPADQRSGLDAYARGVNAFIETHRDRLPVEFRLLAYQPAPWKALDSLLVSLAMWQDLSTEFPRKLERESFSRHLPAQLIPDLYPVGSWRDIPPANQGRDITAPHLVEQIPLDPSQSRLQTPSPAPANATQPTTQDLLAMSAAFGADRCDGCRAGSNNWAVSGVHTASGAPLLSNDMHLNLGIPDLWYEASLHADLGAAVPGATRLDVTGFTLPGVPFVIVGRNTHVAWGVTNLGADVQDLRVEHLRGTGDSTEYQRPDGTWTAVNHRKEVIRVRGGLNTTLDVETTMHPGPTGEMETPIISPLYPGESRALSLAWTVYDPAALSSPFLGVNTAADGSALAAAFAQFGGPSLNLVWADTGGHIGYHAIGFIPVRGPAVQHPRAAAPETPAPTSGPLPDEGNEDAPPPGPEALLTAGPHLILSSFTLPQQRHRRPPAAPVQRRTRPAPVGSRVAPVRRRGAGHLRAQVQQPGAKAPSPRAQARPTPQPAEAPLPPEPAPVNYTIGSPSSPVPVDALDASQAWTAYIPYDQLPSVVDPRSGMLSTANGRITPDDYPYFVTNDWADPSRAERIVRLLAHRRGMTPEDSLHMEMDAHSETNLALAQRLAYAVDHTGKSALQGDAARLHKAADILRQWDGDMRADSAAAAIISVMRPALWSALLTPQIAAHDNIDPTQAAPLTELYTWGDRTGALEVLIQHEPARWLPRGSANWNDFLATMLATALRTAHAPTDLAHWQYGDLHKVEIAHPIFNTHRFLSRLVGVRSTTGRKPAPGDATTIDQIGTHFGPSERFTADLSSEDAALGNITTGQSANPRSPWYLDQFKPWLEGRSFTLPTGRTEATHTLTLTP